MTQLVDVAVTETPADPKRAGTIKRVLQNPFGLVSIIILIAIVALGLLAPVLLPSGPNAASLENVNAPFGTPGYPLGGDQSGRDILARLLYSINVSVMAAAVGTGISVAVGTVFGLIAGYVGKTTDAIASWVSNLLMTFPALVLLIVLFPTTGGSYPITMAIFGVLLAPGVFRLVRGLVAGVRNELYVDAARVSGLSDVRILSRHVLVVVRGPIIISAAFLAGTSVAIQSGLAFLGLGSSTDPSWGVMVSDGFRNLYVAPLHVLWPSLMLGLMTMSFVLLGNAYRDALESPTYLSRAARAKVRADRRKREPRDDSGHAPQESGHLLEVRDLSIAYPNAHGDFTTVVRNVSLTVDRGEVLGLVGESGSGKTQTSFAVLRLLPQEAVITSGGIFLDGKSVTSLSGKDLLAVRGSDIAYVPQEPMSNLDPSCSIGAQLVYGIRAGLGLSRREARKLAFEMLVRVGIADPKRTFRAYPHEISGGMAQRVLIAGAVACQPRLLIADEPTTALDVTVQAEILDLLRDLQREMKMAMLLVTHNWGVVADICDRVAVMKDGSIVEVGPTDRIVADPAHLYTQSLLASILDTTKLREDLVTIGESK
jgi:peptide/nickel transport system permease protein